MRGILVRFSIALVLVLSVGLGIDTVAGTHNVTFSVTSGGPAPSGTITFADPEPGDAVVLSTAFEFTDGIATWTQADDTLFAFHHGGFVAGSLAFISVKVVDVDTGRALEIFSSVPGSYQVCTSADASGACTQFPPTTEGAYTLAPVVSVPALGFWAAAALVGLMSLLLVRRVVLTRQQANAGPA